MCKRCMEEWQASMLPQEQADATKGMESLREWMKRYPEPGGVPFWGNELPLPVLELLWDLGVCELRRLDEGAGDGG